MAQFRVLKDLTAWSGGSLRTGIAQDGGDSGQRRCKVTGVLMLGAIRENAKPEPSERKCQRQTSPNNEPIRDWRRGELRQRSWPTLVESNPDWICFSSETLALETARDPGADFRLTTAALPASGLGGLLSRTSRRDPNSSVRPGTRRRYRQGIWTRRNVRAV